MIVNALQSERGYAMAALLVAMGVIAIVVSTTLPVYSTMARREREAELLFRGQQYARAVTLFQRKYANALPPNLDVLLNERFLRKQYKDPITQEDFQLVGPGSPELALAANAPPAQAQQQGRGASTMGQPQQPSGRGFQSNPTITPGGILGVVSKSRETSLRLYNNHDKYNEWVFIATQMSVAAGGPTGAPMPGGRGVGAGAGRGRQGEPPPDTRGRFGQPFPDGGRGRPAGPGMQPPGFPGRGRF